MSWLNRVRNSLSFAKKRDTPEDLWVKCPRCHDMLFSREYQANLYVCPRCEYHGRIGADVRLSQILDEGYEVLPAPQVREDPLKFRDSKKYTDRLKQARANTEQADAFDKDCERLRVGAGEVRHRLQPARPNNRAQLVPPKPNELLITRRTGCSRLSSK